MNTEPDQKTTDFANALGLAADAASRSRTVPMPEVSIGNGVGVGARGISPVAGLDARPSAEEGGDRGGESAQPIEQYEEVAELARHVRSVFERNWRHRRMSGVDEMLAKMQRLAAREYSPREMALIARTRTQPIFIGELDKKRIALAAMLSEIFNNAADKPWTLEPTPMPEVPEEVTERAVRSVMEPITRINEAAMMLHLMRVQAGQADENAPPEGMVSADVVQAAMGEKMDEVRRLQLEEARRAAEGMENTIHDQMVEGRFYKSMPEAFDYVTTYGTVVMYGPLPRMKLQKTYVRGSKPGDKSTLKMQNVPVLEYGVFSPWDCFPSPGAKDVDDGDFVVRRRFNPSDLAQWARAKSGDKLYGGWNAKAVSGILARYPEGGLREMLPEDAEREALQNESGQTRTEPGYIEGLEMFGTVRGSELLGIGIRKILNGKKVEEDGYYDIDVTTIKDVVVCCRITEPELGRPLAKAVIYPVNESWWGEGPMQKGEAAQRIMNSCVRWMCVNMAQAAAPQMVITDKNRIAPETGGFELEPGKVWVCEQEKYSVTSQGVPVQLMQPGSNLGDLLAAYKHFKGVVDELTGVPDYSYGMGQGAAVRSSSTLAMLTEGQSRIVKYSVGFFAQMVCELVEKTYAWNMLHGEDESIKGDVSCNPSGVLGLMLVEQNYNRLIQFLQLTNNGADMQIVGQLGRATILREIAKKLRLNPDKLVGSETALQEQQQLAQLKQELEVQQQQANLAATEQGTENQAQMMEERGESGNPPINAERAAQAQQRKVAAQMQTQNENGVAAQMTPQGRGALKSILANPRGRALAAARGAATRAANAGAAEEQ